MKKKVLMIVLLSASIFILTSCGKKKEYKYNIDELSSKYVKYEKYLEKETEYFTEDDESSEEYTKAVEKAAKKANLPVNQEITVKGKFRSYTAGKSFFLSPSNDKYDGIYCKYKGSPNKLALIKDKENISVTGTLFSKGKGDDGVERILEGITDCKINSPVLNKIKFENNISECITSDPDYYIHVMGIVTKVQKLDGDMLNEMNEITENEVEADYMFGLRDDDSIIICLINSENIGSVIPKEGDKICTNGTTYKYGSDDDDFIIDVTNSNIMIFK